MVLSVLKCDHTIGNGDGGVIVNGDFEEGLPDRPVVSDSAFVHQPVLAGDIRAFDVMIDGAPPVPLGDDFAVSTWHRPGRLPEAEVGFLGVQTGTPREQGDAISLAGPVASELSDEFALVVALLGFTAPSLPGVCRRGYHSKIGLTAAGEEVLLEAMRFEMVIDVAHTSEEAIGQAYDIAAGQVPALPHPLAAAHNRARFLGMKLLGQFPPLGTVPGPEERRNLHTWPNESTKFGGAW